MTTADTNQVSITIHKQETQAFSQERIMEEVSFQDLMFSESVKRTTRFVILLVCIGVLIIGRFSVPDTELDNIQDVIMDLLKFANDFINTPGNETYRNAFQIACSFLVDLTFIITFGYWVLKGENARLPLSLGMFYITRAIVQKVSISPFPEGFYWDSPGVPSLVVPYGRGSDFFFSGHSGFLIICASEWNKIKMPKVRNFILVIAAYTVLILLTYRIHYSIDVFTGIFFSEWCHGKADIYIKYIERIPKKIILFAQHRFYFTDRHVKDPALSHVAPQEQEEEEEVKQQP